MALVDTHTHLESFARKGALKDILTRAREAGVDTMITIGTSPEDWRMYREIAAGHPGFVRYTAGLHPCSVDDGWEQAVDGLEDFWNGRGQVTQGPRPVALGECGLDRFHLPKDAGEAERIFAWQRGAFARQLEIVKRLGCPVV